MQPLPEPDREKVKTVWVLASSPEPGLLSTREWLPKPDRVIAADGGSNLAAVLGIVPDLVVGDLDSADSVLIKEWESKDVEIRLYDHNVKWETDTELAALAALEWQPNTIILIGAIGGRLDHTLANILLLTHPRLTNLDVRIVDGPHEVSLAKAGQWNPIYGLVGDTVTLLPLGADATGVRTHHLRWPLTGETLHGGHGRGVSNQIEADGAQVRFDQGQLLVVVVHG